MTAFDKALAEIERATEGAKHDSASMSKFVNLELARADFLTASRIAALRAQWKAANELHAEICGRFGRYEDMGYQLQVVMIAMEKSLAKLEAAFSTDQVIAELSKPKSCSK